MKSLRKDQSSADQSSPDQIAEGVHFSPTVLWVSAFTAVTLTYDPNHNTTKVILLPYKHLQ